MDLSLAVAILSLLVTLGVHLVRGGRGDGRQDARIEQLQRQLRMLSREREHMDAHFEHEINRLRDWRHNKVGESPGLAAMVKAEDIESRVERIERYLNGPFKESGR